MKDEKFVVDGLFLLCSAMMLLNIWWAYLITMLIVRAIFKDSDKDFTNQVKS